MNLFVSWKVEFECFGECYCRWEDSEYASFSSEKTTTTTTLGGTFRVTPVTGNPNYSIKI